jgi:hypothetical protein
VSSELFTYIGYLTSAVVALALILVLVAVVLGLLAKKEIFLFPRFTFFLIEKLRSPLKFLFSLVSRNGYAVEEMGIKVCNRFNLKKYESVKLAERMVILPQCLRDINCEARLDPFLGFKCERCGKCIAERIREIDGSVRVFISPGGTFSKRLVESHRPRAVLGVACPRDLFEGMSVCAQYRIPVQGVLLLRDGCVGTAVDDQKVFNTLVAGEEKFSPRRHGDTDEKSKFQNPDFK